MKIVSSLEKLWCRVGGEMKHEHFGIKKVDEDQIYLVIIRD